MHSEKIVSGTGEGEVVQGPELDITRPGEGEEEIDLTELSGGVESLGSAEIHAREMMVRLQGDINTLRASHLSSARKVALLRRLERQLAEARASLEN